MASHLYRRFLRAFAGFTPSLRARCRENTRDLFALRHTLLTEGLMSPKDAQQHLEEAHGMLDCIQYIVKLSEAEQAELIDDLFIKSSLLGKTAESPARRQP
eukprot:gnl/Hemi2/21213_TR7033_c0_g1_i1.p1 gnl/Hemi2/21213_TR7033_c0_g1~~gnl/Hemi2/21213_TR7033_c0_g1_i1.p1  ORF type:complete len:118 (+),score=35.43 gnl/Hemi2/21213_TR7033_c0_g1_i1:52-354(+)